MIFYSKIKKPKRIHIGENVINRLKSLFENSEDEGGMLNVYDMATDPGTGEPTLFAKYNYLPNDDNVYADFSNYKGKGSLRKINGTSSTRVTLGQGDLVKTKDNISPDKVPVEGGKSIDCFNLSMLGDDKVKTMLAHIYKGKAAAYPLNKNYRIKVTGDNGEYNPNLIKGEYLKKIKDLILHTPELYNFKPNYVIYPQSSSSFNEYILKFLTSKNGPFPYAKPIAKENEEFVMTKSDVWDIDYDTLIGLGKSEINQNYGYREFYSKNKTIKNLYEESYFSNTIATILEPRILKLIPLIRKMYFLEGRAKENTNDINQSPKTDTNSSVEQQSNDGHDVNNYTPLQQKFVNKIKDLEEEKEYYLNKKRGYTEKYRAAKNSGRDGHAFNWKLKIEEINEYLAQIRSSIYYYQKKLEATYGGKNEGRNIFVLTPYAEKLFEGAAAVEEREKINNVIKKFKSELDKLVSNGYSPKELISGVNKLLSNKTYKNYIDYLRPYVDKIYREALKNIWGNDKEKLANKNLVYNDRPFEGITPEEEKDAINAFSNEKLVNIEEIPSIEAKMQPEEKQRMYDYINGEIGEDERKYMINYIHDYFMNEMEHFNNAGEKYGLTFDFRRPPFGEALLLKIYRFIFSHTTGENKIASGPRSKNFLFPNYKTFVNAFESGKIEVETDDISKAIPVLDNEKAKNGADRTYKNYFTINMPNLIRNAEKTDTIKNYAIVPRLSIYNQFKFNDNVDLSKYSSEGRYLIIDDNYASGASLRNAAKLLHDTLGVSYKNIKALTPGDMGGAATGGAQGEDIATYAAEGALVNDLRKGRLKNVFGNNPVDLEVLNRIKEVAGRIRTNKKTDLPKLDKNGNPIFKVSHQVSDELADSHFDANGNSVLGQSSLPDFNYNVNSVDVPNHDFKIRDYKKYLQNQNPVSSFDDESEPLKMAANKVQSAPVSTPRIEKVDIFNQLSSSEKEEERRMLRDKLKKVMGELKKANSRKDKANPLNGERAIVQNEINNLITQRDELRAEIRRITTEYAQTSEPVSQVQQPVNSNNNAQKKRGGMGRIPYPEDVRKQIIDDTTAQLNVLIANRDKVKGRMKKTRSQEEYDELRNEKALLDKQIMYARNRIFGLKNNRKMSDNAKIRAAERRKEAQTAK